MRQLEECLQEQNGEHRKGQYWHRHSRSAPRFGRFACNTHDFNVKVRVQENLTSFGLQHMRLTLMKHCQVGFCRALQCKGTGMNDMYPIVWRRGGIHVGAPRVTGRVCGSSRWRSTQGDAPRCVPYRGKSCTRIAWRITSWTFWGTPVITDLWK